MSCAASSSGVSGKALVTVSALLRTQRAAPISIERGCESAASSTLPMAASSFLSSIASEAAIAARPLADGSLSVLALCRLGQSRCQCEPPQCLHLTY
eukprot:4360531-Pleurochrysis_carterae.AAC.3